VGKSFGTRPLRRPRKGGEDNIKMTVGMYAGWKLAQDRVQ
jgi:hypothetical protein